MVDRNPDRPWLGGEALPGGLGEITDAIQGGATPSARRVPAPRKLSPMGLIAIVAHWMRRKAPD